MSKVDIELQERLKIQNTEFELSIDDLSEVEKNNLINALSQDVGLVRPAQGKRILEEADVLLKAWARGEPKFCGREIRSLCGVKSGTPLGRMVKRAIGSISPDYLIEYEKYEKIKGAFNKMTPAHRNFAAMHYIERNESGMKIYDYIKSIGMYKDSYYKELNALKEYFYVLFQNNA